MTRILTTLVIVSFLASAARAADDAPTEAAVRKAVARALPFVETDGLARMEERNCMSCHTVTFMLWAHEEAAAHGIQVVRKKLTEWTDWSWDKSLATRVFFKLDAKVAESLSDQLGDVIGQGSTHEKDLVAARG